MYTGEETVRRISVLASRIPRGGRIWQALGGRYAVTRETEALLGLEATELGIAWSRGGRKGNQPPARDFPVGYDEMEEKSGYLERNASAWRRKYGKPKKR